MLHHNCVVLKSDVHTHQTLKIQHNCDAAHQRGGGDFACEINFEFLYDVLELLSYIALK